MKLVYPLHLFISSVLGLLALISATKTSHEPPSWAGYMKRLLQSEVNKSPQNSERLIKLGNRNNSFWIKCWMIYIDSSMCDYKRVTSELLTVHRFMPRSTLGEHGKNISPCSVIGTRCRRCQRGSTLSPSRGCFRLLSAEDPIFWVTACKGGTFFGGRWGTGAEMGTEEPFHPESLTFHQEWRC